MTATEIKDSDATAVVGTRIRRLGEDLHTISAGIRRRIEAIEAPAPWGNDSPGQQFSRTYTAPITGGGPLNQELQAALNSAGEELIRLGDAIVATMAVYVRTNSDVTDAFRVRGTGPRPDGR